MQTSRRREASDVLTSVNAADPAFAGGMRQGNSAPANRAALQAALDTGKNTHIPAGGFHMEPGLQMRGHGQRVFGQGPHQSRLICAGSGDFFTTGGCHDCAFHDFSLNGNGNVTGGAAIVISGSAAQGQSALQAWGADVHNVVMDQMWSGVYLTDVNTATLTDLSMRGMRGDFGIMAYAEGANRRIDVIRLLHVGYNAHPSAVAADRGTGIVVDGCVHSVVMHNFFAVGALRGIVVCNTPCLPFGVHASFLFGHDCEVDFPKYEALLVDCIDRTRFVNSYFHGSKQSSNIVLRSGVRDAKFVACNISGAYANGLSMEGNILDVTACELDWNGLQAPNLHSGILLQNTAQNVRIVGGGSTDTKVAYGIYRMNPATIVQLAAADGHYGLSGVRNF